MPQRLQFRRGTAASATAHNPILADGEQGYETDTGRSKIGDGVTPWNSLIYMNKGDKGDKGDTGDTGAKGDPGDLDSSLDYSITGDWDHTGDLKQDGQLVLTDADTGPGNGLDADTLDGIEGANYTRLDLTNLGKEGNVPITTLSSEAAWAAVPVGFASMIHSASLGMPGVATYIYFMKIAARDTGGGWAGIAVDYTNGDIWTGKAATDTVYATWTSSAVKWNGGAKHVSTATPGSGDGVDGDVWFKY